MPRNPTGRWVARAGATGGSRSYRGQMPVNYYAALVLIVLLGLASIIYSRHEYQNPASASTTPPAVGTTWYAGYAFDICGGQVASLPSNQGSSKQAFYTTGNGVITIAPQTASQAGDNATLAKFVDAYPKLEVTNDTIRIPNGKSVKTYRNGQKCAKGTPDAGKVGTVAVTSWANFLPKTKPVRVTGTFTDLKFSSNQEITIGFVPKGTKLPRPNGSVVTALLNASNGASSPSSTTPTTAPGSATTAPGSATTAPGSATTAPGSATTAPGSATTAPASTTAPTSTTPKK